MEVVVTTGAIRCAKLQSNHHHQQTNTRSVKSTEGKPELLMSENFQLFLDHFLQYYSKCLKRR